jgi:hypothetical protein
VSKWPPGKPKGFEVSQTDESNACISDAVLALGVCTRCTSLLASFTLMQCDASDMVPAPKVSRRM